MKKFIIILCVLMMIPLYAFAAGSPTLESLVTSDPSILFIMAEKTDDWPTIVRRLKKLENETEGFILLDAVFAYIDKPYERVEWALTAPVIVEHEPFILLINQETVVKQEVSITEDGKVITDFTECEPGIYYILFYIKGA